MAVPVANRKPAQVDIGPGLLYIAALGTAEPTGLTLDEWGSDWVELGYTDKGSTFKIAPTVDDVRVAEERDPVQEIVSSVKSTLTMDLAQITAWHLGVALGGGTIETADGVTTFEPPAAGSEQEVMLGWRSIAGDEAMLWRRAKPSGALNLERSAGSAKALIPVEFGLLVPTGGAKTWKWFGADPAKTGPALGLIMTTPAPSPPTLETRGPAVAPDFGAAAGGTAVTITGRHFTGATGVLFASTGATSFLVVNDTTITCTTPAHAAGLVNVTVQHALGNAVLTGAFTYV